LYRRRGEQQQVAETLSDDDYLIVAPSTSVLGIAYSEDDGLAYVDISSKSITIFQIVVPPLWR